MGGIELNTLGCESNTQLLGHDILRNSGFRLTTK